jgi:hypothetical protein
MLLLVVFLPQLEEFRLVFLLVVLFQGQQQLYQLLIRHLRVVLHLQQMLVLHLL